MEGSSWDVPPSTRPKAAVLTAWMQDWTSSGRKIGQRSGLWYVLIVMLHLCNMPHAEQLQNRSRVRKVATLVRAGEKGRALAAARNAPPVPVTEQTVQEIQSHFSTGSCVRPILVRSGMPTTLRKTPRLSEPGPLSKRAEHWYDFGALTGGQQLVCSSGHTHRSGCCSSFLCYSCSAWGFLGCH